MVAKKVIVKKNALDCRRKMLRHAYKYDPYYIWYTYDMESSSEQDECKTLDKPPFYAYTHKLIAHIIVQNFGEQMLNKVPE